MEGSLLLFITPYFWILLLLLKSKLSKFNNLSCFAIIFSAVSVSCLTLILRSSITEDQTLNTCSSFERDEEKAFYPENTLRCELMTSPRVLLVNST